MVGARGVLILRVPISWVPTKIVDTVEVVIIMESLLDEDTLTKGLLKSWGCRINVQPTW
ncbi:hypothetical protein PIB30_098664, partial [Stylosanthes scabra]|nr:hypothetical protein [Stylosanthes scabra]